MDDAGRYLFQRCMNMKKLNLGQIVGLIFMLLAGVFFGSAQVPPGRGNGQAVGASKSDQDFQKIHDANLSKYKAKHTRHELKLNGGAVATFQVVGVKSHAVGATITTVTAALPSDGGVWADLSYDQIFPPSGASPSQWFSAINQNGISDCYLLAKVSELAGTPAGQDYLKAMVQQTTDATGKAIPGRVTVYFLRNGIWTGVEVDYQIATGLQVQIGTNNYLFAAIIEKAYAFYRTGADTFASLNYGFCNAVASDFGLTILTAPNSCAKARVITKAGGGVEIATGLTTRADIPANHAEGSVPESMQPSDTTRLMLVNPWGELNHGSSAVTPTVSDADLAMYGISLTASGAPVTPAILPKPIAFVSTAPAPTPPPSTTLPTPPWSPNAFNVTTTGFTASWTDTTIPVTSQDGLRVYLSTDDVTFTMSRQIAVSSETQAVVTGLSGGTTYWFKVSAYNAVGEVFSNEVRVTTAGAVTPPPTTLPGQTLKPYTGPASPLPAGAQFVNGVLNTLQ